MNLDILFLIELEMVSHVVRVGTGGGGGSATSRMGWVETSKQSKLKILPKSPGFTE